METLKPPPALPSVRLAVLLAFLAEGLLTFMDACIKSVTPHYHTLQIAFLRFGMGSIYAAIVFAAMRPTWPTVESVRVNALRSLLAVVTACAFFFALSRLEMAEAMALSFVSPLFIALFGVVLLKERFDARLAAALAAGVAGMTVIMSGKVGGSGFSLDAWVGVAAVLVSAVCYALVVVLLRARAKVDPLPTIVLFQNVGPALLLAGPAYYVWTAPTAAHLALFVGVGALGVAGHTLLANAFARAEAARLAPVHYVVLLWGILFGWLFFGEIPGLTTLFGAALIVVATLLTQRR